MKKILFYSLVLVFLISCGGSKSKPDQEMLIGELYTVSPGDKIIKTTDTAIVNIIHIDAQDTSTVELIVGKASIKH